jgi:hypothetical protein
MSTNDTFLAIFLASKTSPRMKAWNSLSKEARLTKMQEGIAAWKAWTDKHHAAIVGMGGPLGKTKKVSERGIEEATSAASRLMLPSTRILRSRAAAAFISAGV